MRVPTGRHCRTVGREVKTTLALSIPECQWGGESISRAALSSPGVRLPTIGPHTMRTLGFRTHALVALAAAVGLIAALGRPWYAPAPGLVDEEVAIAVSYIRSGLDRGELCVCVNANTSEIGHWDRLVMPKLALNASSRNCFFSQWCVRQ